MEYYVTLDVGGTNIKAGVIDNNNSIVNGTVKTYNANANKSKEVILNSLVDIIKKEADLIDRNDLLIDGVGLAFPGPFDYEKGISYITGINKYESLYGINVKNELLNHIYSNGFLNNKLSSNFSILFDNDANLYAMGEYYYGKGKGYNKSIYICLGTGIGSAFVENGHLVKFREDVPKNGWVYNTPFKESIIDDYISARGIIKLADNIMGSSHNASVKELADTAKAGNKLAIKTFDTFGNMMGHALLPFIKSFKPEAIILGGQISKSSDLFKDALISAISPYKLIIKISENSSISTLLGAYNLFDSKLSR